MNKNQSSAKNRNKVALLITIGMLLGIMVQRECNMYSFLTESLRSVYDKGVLAVSAEAPTKNRTAVVWTTTALTSDCEFSRLKHLVETAGMDIWILHSHATLSKTGHKSEIALSKMHIEAIPGLKVAHQHMFSLEPFDSSSSGSSKSSFINFATTHTEYDFVWHTENDCFYTGPWVDFLRREDASTDFLSPVVLPNKQITDSSWSNWNLANCSVENAPTLSPLKCRYRCSESRTVWRAR